MSPPRPPGLQTSSATTEKPDELPPLALAALEFEKSSWAQGSVTSDAFYKLPFNTEHVSIGTLLKAEDADTKNYTLPPGLALSRIMYQSATLTGSPVPVSAYVLWPFSPRKAADGYQVVAWAHGTSGFTAEAAPSHHKNLWQYFECPFQLALQGYVVVATDYAGLGIGEDASGKDIVHQYLASPSQANDVFYSVQAAQAAYPRLSKQFVVIGHSQGGGAAWACAQRQAVTPVLGYLGAVAVSPVTVVTKEPGPARALLAGVFCLGVASVFPDFKYSNVLTLEGKAILKTTRSHESGFASSMSLFSSTQMVQPDWAEDPYVQKYQSLIANGDKKITEPLLVIQGDADPLVTSTITTDTIDKTIDSFPSSQLEYVTLSGISHVPALYASQHVYMDWIADRFNGKEAPSGLQKSILEPTRPMASYQSEPNWFIAPATAFYHTP